MDFIQRYGTALSAIGAAIAFMWSIIQFLAVRSREARHREYQTFHELIKTLVAGNASSAAPFIDQQAAALFELRNYPRYFPFVRRTLFVLKETWAGAHVRLVEEIDLTVSYIDHHEANWYRRLNRRLFSSQW